MTWPTTTISTSNMDAGGDNPALARADIKQMADNVNAIKDEFANGDGAKLLGIEANATADQSDAEIKTAYENNADTNEFSDTEKSKLSGIEASATADQSDAEIKTAYENNADTNEFTDAEKSKLSGIEDNSTNYAHPIGDGNLHVPATSTTNDGKVLTAGSTAGSLTWETPVMDVVGKTCVFRITGLTGAENGEIASPWRKTIFDLADPSSYYPLSGYQLTLDAGSYELVDFTTIFADDTTVNIIAYNATAGSDITTSSYHEIGTTNTGVESFGKLFTLTVQSAIEFRGDDNFDTPLNAWLKITRVY